MQQMELLVLSESHASTEPLSASSLQKDCSFGCLLRMDERREGEVAQDLCTKDNTFHIYPATHTHTQER